MHRKPHCLIIGGGVRGPALALFLHKAGISSSVFEAYPEHNKVGGGLALAPNGMNVLAELGLAEKLLQRGSLAMTNIFLDERGNQLARFGNGGYRYGQPAASFMRHDLNALLREEMESRGIAIAYEKRMANISISPDGTFVTTHFTDGSVAEGDFLVGADGVRSRTRELILPDGPHPEFVGIIGIGGCTPRSAVPDFTVADSQAFTFTFGPTGFFGYCGGAPDEAMWWSNLPRDREISTEELAALSADQLKREMLERYGAYHSPIPALIKAADKVIALSVHDVQRLPRWSRGRIIVIGDAAHAVSPNAGQGASMALEDAMLLAKLVRDCGGRIEAAFKTFEDQRRARVEKVVAEGRRRGADKAIVSPVQSRIRNIVIGLMLRLFGERSQRWLYEYKIDWAK